MAFEIHFSLDKASQIDVLGHNGHFLCNSGPQDGVLEDHLGRRPIMTRLGYAGGYQSTVGSCPLGTGGAVCFSTTQYVFGKSKSH